MSMKMVDGTKLDASLEATADAIRQQRGTDDAIPFDMTGGTGFAAAIAGTEDKFITFSSESSFTLGTTEQKKSWNGKLEYSTDKETWTEWDGTAAISAGESGGKYVIYLRGLHNSHISVTYPPYPELGSGDINPFVITGTPVSCAGNIEMLLDWQIAGAGLHPSMTEFCFYHLFYGCKALAEGPELPSPYLSKGCYNGMFYGCTALAKAPALPAAVLVNQCYESMFSGCAALEEPPVSSAVSLARECFYGMFYGCTLLKRSMAMPAGAEAAYMCCHAMYYECTALETLAELPATTLATSCYSGMYRGCTSVKVSEVQGGEYQYPFRIPTEGTGTAANHALEYLFLDTGGDFTGSPYINTTYYTTKPPVPAV